MSVFTAVSFNELSRWLEHYSVGRLIELNGIPAGVQNSNFFVTTTLGRYVLTLFESIPRSELPFYLYLTAHLSHHGLPVPAPIADRDNEYLGTLHDRPAILVTRLYGTSMETPDARHCRKVGAMLAGIHRAGFAFGRKQENPRGASWRRLTAQQVLPHLPAADRALLQEEIHYQQQQDFSSLPHGIIHADLFRDNVLWDGEYIGGVIDFYFAGYDCLLFDVAVTLNDWCRTADNHYDAACASAFLQAYYDERPLTAEERACWPAILRAAALRFWLSRAYDKYLPLSGEMVFIKNPEEYRDTLLLARQSAPELPVATGNS